MDIKLVAVDLDDTLLDKSNQVSPHTREIIRQAVAQGVTVTVATGRMYQSAVRFARQLKIDVPIITYNGALIKSCLSEEVLYEQPIELETARGVLELFKSRGWYVQSYIDDVLCVEKINDKVRCYEKIIDVKAEAIGAALYAPPKAPTKLLTIGEPAELEVIWQVVAEQFGDRLYITKSKANYLEMAHPSVNKGQALRFLAAKLGITREQVMAVGDSLNDLDMIEYAGWGVAMGNAAERVKAVAQAVTLRNDEDGVAEAIRRFALRQDLKD
ncbi:Sugar phosphatase YidA [bioreactor metagenome]|uniref:Sugar phosphatase YidA n=1 Tax=bioreactor metagenome TaxID=1076179 RepID=A0A644TQD9_9ZZZZ|nr:Cof-type HAD-IIB family hydrolase [Negativicutes bacterium]